MRFTGKIVAEHGESTDTYRTAKDYLATYEAEQKKAIEQGEDAEDVEAGYFNEKDDIEKEFLNALCEDYLIILKNEYEYLTSEKAIIGSIEANGYEFTENGNIY